MRVGWTKELRGSWRLDRRELAWNHGEMRSTPETVADKIGSSEEDRLKMSAFEVLVEFSLVTHASDSPHKHIVLHTFLCFLVNPKLCSSVLFSPIPPIVFLCSGKEMCVTPSATS